MATTTLTSNTMVNLMEACVCGDLQKVIQTYCRNQTNFNVDLKTTDSTLLHKAVESRNGQLVSYLVDKGATVNIQEDMNNTTPLMSACKCCDKRIVDYLISKNADINMQDITGSSCLHIAAANGYQDILKLLLDSGADINVQNNKGNTPLHLAAFYGREQIAAQLLKHSPDKSKLNRKGKSPTDIAQSKNHTEVNKLLQKPETTENQAAETATQSANHTEEIKALQKPEFTANPVVKRTKTPPPPSIRKTEVKMVNGRQHHAQKAVSLNLDSMLQRKCEVEIESFFNQFRTEMKGITKPTTTSASAECNAGEEKIYERINSIEKDLNRIEEKFVSGKQRASQKEQVIQELNNSLPKYSQKLDSISKEADCRTCCKERGSIKTKIDTMMTMFNNLRMMFSDLQEQYFIEDSVEETKMKSLPTSLTAEDSIYERLRKCYKDVSDNLDADPLIISLFSEGVLTRKNKEILDSRIVRFEKAEKLWDILLKKPEKEKWFETLINSLKEDEGTAWLAEKLVKDRLLLLSFC